MYKYIIILGTFVLSLTVNAQHVFESWAGNYSGQMILANAHRANDTVAVKFDFQPIIKDSVWSHKMTFNSDKWGTIVKDYLVKRLADENFVDYHLDEQNGIIMELTVMNGAVYGMYDVAGIIYTTTLRETEKGLFMELYGCSKNNPIVTHSEAEEDGQSFEVTSTKPILVQSVLLKKK